ncbi:hypothetical protein COV16_04660 [Candidatus Woesearchaeota archaeon CG10_big_fil_rev_8_21_14_0_10_34_8]|nr:MAG: hypothetical protein COV16_04660 [Candidatus Woesearchaeota archaeon CG10_big_fil_rev_8_21_14_0_10_34_8]
MSNEDDTDDAIALDWDDAKYNMFNYLHYLPKGYEGTQYEERAEIILRSGDRFPTPATMFYIFGRGEEIRGTTLTKVIYATTTAERTARTALGKIATIHIDDIVEYSALIQTT